MAHIKIEGLDELTMKLKKNATMDDVKRTVRKNGHDLQKKIQMHADFTKGYVTGQTKRSIGLTIRDSGMTAEAGATTYYGEYLERGTRLMDAQPFVGPAEEEQKKKFISDMKKLVR